MLNHTAEVHHWLPKAQSGEATRLVPIREHEVVGDLPTWFIPVHQIELGRHIASESFGAVYEGTWLGSKVVVKQVRTDQADADNRRQFKAEADLWFSLNHDHIIKLYGAGHEERPFFVCERATRGTLTSFAKGKERLEIWRYIYQASLGLRHLHDHGIVHGDLPIKRFLRVATKHSDTYGADVSTSVSDEERDVGMVQVVSTAVKAMRAKAKWVILLKRGFGPAKAMKKLKITSLDGKNFHNFARYYARYLAKNPKKAASLPATAEDAALTIKMDQWIAERVIPPQIGTKLQEFGQKDVKKYAAQYMSLWGANQARISAKVK